MNFSTELIDALPGLEIRQDAPLGLLTTFRCGGNASRIVYPQSEAELAELLKLLKDAGEEYFILGRGSNILVSDRGYAGTVISLREHFAQIESPKEGMLLAGAGAMMPDLSKAACSSGLAGLEFMAGIPGTVGGGVRMNAGAYGSEMKDVLVSARLLLPDGSIRSFDAGELDLSYRHSRIPELNAVVLSAVFSLEKGEPEIVRQKMDDLQSRRREKQPLNYGSAGSTFKRPEGYFAGKLIDDAGLRGFRIGDAAVSEKHAGFVVNLGSATASEVCSVIRHVQETVWETFGVKLEREVIFLGEM